MYVQGLSCFTVIQKGMVKEDKEAELLQLSDFRSGLHGNSMVLSQPNSGYLPGLG